MRVANIPCDRLIGAAGSPVSWQTARTTCYPFSGRAVFPARSAAIADLGAIGGSLWLRRWRLPPPPCYRRPADGASVLSASCRQGQSAVTGRSSGRVPEARCRSACTQAPCYRRPADGASVLSATCRQGQSAGTGRSSGLVTHQPEAGLCELLTRADTAPSRRTAAIEVLLRGCLPVMCAAIGRTGCPKAAHSGFSMLCRVIAGLPGWPASLGWRPQGRRTHRKPRTFRALNGFSSNRSAQRE